MRTVKATIEFYAIASDDGNVDYRCVDNENRHISLMAIVNQGGHLFDGPARELQAWAARRNIPYQHVTLNVPVELEI